MSLIGVEHGTWANYYEFNLLKALNKREFALPVSHPIIVEYENETKIFEVDLENKKQVFYYEPVMMNKAFYKLPHVDFIAIIGDPDVRISANCNYIYTHENRTEGLLVIPLRILNFSHIVIEGTSSRNDLGPGAGVFMGFFTKKFLLEFENFDIFPCELPIRSIEDYGSIIPNRSIQHVIVNNSLSIKEGVIVPMH